MSWFRCWSGRLQEEGQRTEEGGPRGKGRERLRQLGLGNLADRLDSIERQHAGSAGEPDPEFDRAPERDEQDLSDTAELPRAAAENDSEDADGEIA